MPFWLLCEAAQVAKKAVETYHNEYYMCIYVKQQLDVKFGGYFNVCMGQHFWPKFTYDSFGYALLRKFNYTILVYRMIPSAFNKEFIGLRSLE